VHSKITALRSRAQAGIGRAKILDRAAAGFCSRL